MAQKRTLLAQSCVSKISELAQRQDFSTGISYRLDTTRSGLRGIHEWSG